MAEPSQYFVDPDSGKVRIVKPEMVDEAIARNLTPATEEQIKQYDLVQASKRDPLGGVKAFGQELLEGVAPGLAGAAVAGVPGAIVGSALPLASWFMQKIPSAAELGREYAPGLVSEETAQLAKQKRLDLAKDVFRYTTVPGLQQEFGLRRAEDIKAESEAHPVAAGAGMLSSFFVGPAASKILKAGATAAVPLMAAEEVLGAGAGLSRAAAKAAGVDAKNAAYQAARAELAAAQATGDAVEVGVKQAAVNEASVAAQAAVDDAFKIETALAAESGQIPAEFAPVLTKDVLAAGAAARKAAQRMTTAEATRLVDSAGRGQRFVVDAVRKLESSALTTPAVTSKLGSDLAASVEKRALQRLREAPGFNQKLAEIDVALAQRADDLAKGAEKVITEANLVKAQQNLATLEARQQLAAKAIGLGLGRPAEFMMFGLQGAANEAALGDPALVGESLYGMLGFDAGLGVAGAAVEAFAPPTLRAGLRVAKRTGRKLSDAVGRAYVDLAASVTGAEPETIRTVLASGDKLKTRGLRGVIEDATPMPAMGAMPPEVLPSAIQPIKKVDLDAAAKGFRTALEDDVRQIATPAPGGLLYDANTQWRKVQLGQSIEKHAQQLGTDEPMRAAIDDAILLVENTRNKIISSEGLGLEAGQVMPQETAQKSAYLVSRALGDLEKRLVAFKEGAPSAAAIHQELKWIADELYGYMKKYGLESRDLKIVDRQSNAAYAKLRNSIVDIVTNEKTWGQAGALEAQWRQDARTYYAALDNLKATAPKDLMRLLKDSDGRKTVLVIDSNVMKRVVKNIGQEQYATFRDSLGQYLKARSRLISNIESVADFVGASVDKQAVARKIGAAERAFESAIQSSVDAASSAAIKESDAVAKGLYAEQKLARNKMVESLKAEYKQATAERRAQIEEQVKAISSASAIGSLVKGKTTIASVLGAGVNAVASPVATAKKLAYLNKAKMRMADSIEKVSASLSGVGAGVGKASESLGAFYSGKALQNEYKRVEQRVFQLSQDQDELEDQQYAMLGDLVDHAPNVADATKTVNATAIQYLEVARPKPPPGLPPLQLATWEPIDADKRKFLRIRDAVLHPMETLDLASTGALLPEQVKAMDAVYPAMMQEVRAKLLDRIEEKNAIPAKHRAMVSMLLGKDLDGRYQSARMIPTQSVYGSAPQQQAPQKPVPVSRIKDMNVSGRAGQETAAWREAQQGAKLR
jgi:hypothetical protein